MFEFSDLPKEIQALILSKLCKTSLLDAHKFFIEFGLYYRNLLLTYSPDKSDPWTKELEMKLNKKEILELERKLEKEGQIEITEVLYEDLEGNIRVIQEEALEKLEVSISMVSIILFSISSCSKFKFTNPSSSSFSKAFPYSLLLCFSE